MKNFIIIGSIFGFLAVALGAGGSHGFRNILIENNTLEMFNIAVDYMFIHTIMLFVTVFLMKNFSDKKFHLSGWFFTAGLVLFSVNLILISLFDFRIFTFLNPVGGTLLIAGWINLGIQGIRIRKFS